MCFLQETHCSKDRENIWESEWGGKCVYSNGFSNSCGVATLFKKKPIIEDIVRDTEGRKLHIKVKINDYSYGLSNIYAPNRDDPEFFDTSFKQLQELDCVHYVMGGDFNVVQNAKLDRNVNKIYHKNAHNVIENFKMSNDFVDIWRAHNPDKKTFTYMSSKDKVAWSRIDYFLISESLNTNCMDSSIEASVSTDHSLIAVNFATSLQPRGPGIWKFNNTLLQDNQFVQKLKELVKDCKRIYNYMNPTEFWELLKFEMKQCAREWSRAKMVHNKTNKSNVYVKLNELQDELTETQSDSDSKELLHCITSLKSELNAYETLDAKRAAFRCKKSWIQGGEKMTKYYFNMERRNYTSKTMYVVRKSNGSLTKDYREILNLQHDFYEDLYTSNDKVEFNLKNDSGLFISGVKAETRHDNYPG